MMARFHAKKTLATAIAIVLFLTVSCTICVVGFNVDKNDCATTSREKSNTLFNRREWVTSTAKIGAITIGTGATPEIVHAATAPASGLAAKLASRDPNALSNSVFNIPPSVQVYPEFMYGTWDMRCKFGGFLFPSTKIAKSRLTQNVLIPGFQKCSIAALCDVGKDDTAFQLTIDPKTGWEDRSSTLTSQIKGFLGYDAVKEVIYNPKTNPNRLSIDFVDYRTKNAERIELFCNARESEYVKETNVFVCSEYIRQVTFGTGSEVGIPRQVGGNYAHFWTWRPNPTAAPSSDGTTTTSILGNLLTAAYLDPQDAMFFEEPSKPVAVYSHVITGTKVL